MSTLYENIFKALKDKKLSSAKMCAELNLSKSVISDLKSGRKKSLSAPTLVKIADFLGVSVDALLSAETQKTPLTQKDERDIERRLEIMLNELENQQAAIMFDGEKLDDTTRELLILSLKNSMEIGKKLAKQKYTPKKYGSGD